MDKPTDWRSGTRRIFSNEFKLHMVELASKPNANVAQLAREHGVDNNLIFKWLRLWQREGRISRRMPPTIVGPTVPQSFPASPTLVPVELIDTPRVLQMLLLRRHYQLLVRLPAMWNSITVK